MHVSFIKNRQIYHVYVPQEVWDLGGRAVIEFMESERLRQDTCEYSGLVSVSAYLQ